MIYNSFRFVIKLLFAGLSQALQPGLEYQFRYLARVATGITEVNRQFAAAGIQGDVTIQVAEDYTAYVKVGRGPWPNVHEFKIWYKLQREK